MVSRKNSVVIPARIVSDPSIMSGAPVVRGTRVPAETIVAYLRAGHTRGRSSKTIQAFPSTGSRPLSPGPISAAPSRTSSSTFRTAGWTKGLLSKGLFWHSLPSSARNRPPRCERIPTSQPGNRKTENQLRVQEGTGEAQPASRPCRRRVWQLGKWLAPRSRTVDYVIVKQSDIVGVPVEAKARKKAT